MIKFVWKLGRRFYPFARIRARRLMRKINAQAWEHHWNYWGMQMAGLEGSALSVLCNGWERATRDLPKGMDKYVARYLRAARFCHKRRLLPGENWILRATLGNPATPLSLFTEAATKLLR